MKNFKAFTLLELLLVIAIVASLAGLILNALNPAQRLEEANEARYTSLANDIEKALEVYAVENGGNLPTAFNSLSYGYYEICKQGQSTNCINIDAVVPNYLSNIPEDTTDSTSVISGFKIKYDPAKNEVEVYTNFEYTAFIENGSTLTNGLVGYWKMDETSWGTVADSSGNNKNGVSHGAVISQGKFGNSGSFDGINDSIEIPNSVGNLYDFSDNKDFTLSAWVRAENLSGPFIIDTRRTYGGIQSGFTMQLFPSGPHLRLGNADSVFGFNSGSINDYEDGLWHFYTISVRRKGLTEFFVDGERLGTADVSNVGNVNPTFNLRFGTKDGTASNTLEGDIDEIRVYNRALNADEVNELYTRGAPPVAYWKFDEGLGVNTGDSSGNGYEGQLNLGANWTTGVYGNALNLDGLNDFVSVSSWSNYPFPNQGTINFWFKINSSGWSNFNTIVSGSDVSGNSNILYVGRNGAVSDPTCVRIDFGNSGGSYTNHCTGKTFSSNSSWQHLSVTWDTTTSNIRTYVNGSIDNTSSSITTWPSVISKIQIGKDRAYSNRFFGGSIDEMRIYNYARTPEQIVKDMNNN